MTFSDLKKLNPNAAMELLTDKMDAVRKVLNPMLICGDTPEMETLLDWLNLSELSKAFALSILQDEVNATGSTGRLRPAGHAALQMYQDAEWISGPVHDIIDEMYSGAKSLVDCMFNDGDPNDQPDKECPDVDEAVETLQSAVEDSGLLEEGEGLYIAAVEDGTDIELAAGQRLITYGDDIAVYMEEAKAALVEAGAIEPDMELILIGDANAADDDDCYTMDDILSIADPEDMNEDDACLVSSIMDILEKSGYVKPDHPPVVGYLQHGDSDNCDCEDDDADEDEPSAVIYLMKQDGEVFVIMS